jgi:high-affinity nickel permease
MEAVLTTWMLGLVSGMRHAFEPDHVAARRGVHAGLQVTAGVLALAVGVVWAAPVLSAM